MTRDYAFGLSWLVTDCLGQADLKQKKESSFFKFLSGIYPKRHKIADAGEIRDAYKTLRSNLDVARQEITHDIASDLSGLVTAYFVQADLKQEKGVDFFNRLRGILTVGPSRVYDRIKLGLTEWNLFLQRRGQRGKKRAMPDVHFGKLTVGDLTVGTLIVGASNVGDPKVGTPKVDESEVTPKVGTPTVDESEVTPTVDTPNDDEPKVETIIPANPDVANPDVADPIISTLIADNPDVANPDVADPNNLNVEDPPIGTLIADNQNVTSENTSDDPSIESSENTPDDPSIDSSENTSDEPEFGEDIKIFENSDDPPIK